MEQRAVPNVQWCRRCDSPAQLGCANHPIYFRTVYLDRMDD